MSITAQDIEDLKTESKGLIKLGHVKSINLFKEWILNYMESNDDNLPQDWIIAFTTEIYDQFIIKKSATNGSTSTIPTPQPSMSVNNTTNFLTNVKIDIKSYPVFEGQVKDWKKYKRQFTSVATIHGISYLMETSYEMPLPTDSIYGKVLSENTFLYSVIEYSLAKSTAVSRVKIFAKLKDGRGS